MYKRTKIGQCMYDITLKGTKFLMKHMWLYYVLNFTWGIITTLLGYIILPLIHVFGVKFVKDSGRFGPCFYLMIGNNWGGLELGTNFFIAYNMGEEWTLHTKQHEMGHTFQNAIWGPLAIFLIYLPSAVRYWYREFVGKTGKILKPYDCIWFEGNATDTGEYYYNNYLK